MSENSKKKIKFNIRTKILTFTEWEATVASFQP